MPELQGSTWDSHLASQPQDQTPSVIDEFGRAFLYSAVQQPLSGGSQLADKLIGSNLHSGCQFMEAPQLAEFKSLNWHAQQLGAALGMALPFAVAASLTSRLQRFAGFADQSAVLGTTVGLGLRDSAAVGFTYDFLFQPSLGTKDEFWKDRFLNGSIGSVTLATLGASSLSLRSIMTESVERSVLVSVGKNAAISAFSGVPAGILSAELSSLSAGKLASLQDLDQSVYNMLMLGGVLGLRPLQGSINRQKPASRWLEQRSNGTQSSTDIGLTSGRQIDAQDGDSAVKDLPLERPSFPEKINRLANPEVLKPFAQSIFKVTNRWSSLQELATKVEMAAGDLHMTRLDLSSELEHLGISEPKIGDSGWVRSKIGTNAELTMRYEDYLGKRQMHGRLISELNRELGSRRSQLQGAINKFTDTESLPAIQLKTVEKMFLETTRASFDTGGGIMRLPKSALLDNQDTPNLVGALMHELTHNEQGATVMHHLADQAGIDKVASPAQLSLLMRRFKEETGGETNHARINRVLIKRNGVPLTEEQAQRADDLMASFKARSPLGEEHEELGNSQRVTAFVKDLLERWHYNAGFWNMRDSLVSSPRQQMRLFNQSELPEILARSRAAFQAGQDQAPVHHEAEQFLREHLERRLQGLADRRKILYEQYANKLHEQEAHAVGNAARTIAMGMRASAEVEGARRLLAAILNHGRDEFAFHPNQPYSWEILPLTQLSPAAQEQVDQWANHNRVEGSVADGWRGSSRDPSRNGFAVEVNRQKDQLLDDTLNGFKLDFGHLPEQERALSLAQHIGDRMNVHRRVEPDNFDRDYSAFASKHAGQNFALGEFYFSALNGSAFEQALLFKVGGEHLGLSSTLFRNPESENFGVIVHHQDGIARLYDFTKQNFGHPVTDTNVLLVPDNAAGPDNAASRDNRASLNNDNAASSASP